MSSKFSAANKLAVWLAAGAVVAMGVSLGLSTSASAETKTKRIDARSRPYYGSPNVVYQQGPRTRIYVSKRSWLDGGTEVLPGDRKFTDYAFPPSIGYPSFGRENMNRPLDRAPLSPPSDLGGSPQTFPLY